MRTIEDIKNDRRLKNVGPYGPLAICGDIFPCQNPKSKRAVFIFSWHSGWEHLSISFKDRCPTWEEMCYCKDVFFLPGECAMQLHPPESNHINIHDYCLHIWRPIDQAIPQPPKSLV